MPAVGSGRLEWRKGLMSFAVAELRGSMIVTLGMSL